jgi:hypothetical protein
MRKQQLMCASFITVGILLFCGSGYSGDRWEYYTNPSTITEMVKHGNSIWYGSDAGIYHWDLSTMTYTRLTASDGLPNNNVTGIGVADDGKAWISTINGVVASSSEGSWVRDGSFSNYDHTLTLAVDKNGNPWCAPWKELYIGSYGGVFWQSDGEWNSYLNPTYRFICQISISDSGNPWVIISKRVRYELHSDNSDLIGDYAIMYLQGDTWVNAALPVDYEKPTEIVYCPDNTVWVSTKTHILSYSDSVWTPHAIPSEIDSLSIIDLAATPDSSVYALTTTGNVLKFRAGQTTIINSNGGLPNAHELLVDADGTIWAGTVKGDLARLSGDTWQVYQINKVVDMLRDVRIVTTDREGAVWAFAVNGSGATEVYRFTEGVWNKKCTTNVDFIWVNGFAAPVGRIVFDSTNTLWLVESENLVGSAARKLYTLQGDSLVLVTSLTVPSTGIALDQEGTLLCGGMNTNRLLMKYHEGVFETIQTPPELNVYVTPLGTDANGAMWLYKDDNSSMNLKQLFSLKNGSLTSYPTVFTGYTWDGISGFFIDQNNVWLSVNTNAGTTNHPNLISNLYCYETGVMTKVHSYSNGVYLRTVDSQSHLWLSVAHWDDNYRMIINDSVLELDGEIQKTYTAYNGLPSNAVRSITEGSDGSIWFATDMGICRLIPDDGITVVEQNSEEAPAGFQLLQNYPNPFNPATTISFTLPKSGLVTVSVYNITGQKVVTLVDNTMSAGKHSVVFNGAGLASGVYFYRVTCGGATRTGKMLLMK